MIRIQLLPVEVEAEWSDKLNAWHVVSAPFSGVVLPKEFAAPVVSDGVKVLTYGLVREKNTDLIYSLDSNGWTNIRTGHRFTWTQETRYMFTADRYERVEV